MSANTTRPRRAGTFIKLGVASLAVLGLGGAITAAAWQDTVYISAAARAGNVNIQGSLDGGSWLESTTVPSWGGSSFAPAAQLHVDLTSLTAGGPLLPGQTRTKDIQIRNQGTVETEVRAAAVTRGLLFMQDYVEGVGVVLPPTVTALWQDGSNAIVLGAGESATITVTLTAPANLDAHFSGKVGGIILTVNGVPAP